MRVLTRDEAVAIEPAIEDMSDEIVAAVYSASDEVADSQLFATRLKDWLVAQNAAEFRLSAQARHLVRCHELRTHPLQLELPHLQRGLRGYSITLPPGPSAPNVSVTALEHKMVYSRLDGATRIAGFADFTGFDTRDDDRRIALLAKLAEKFAPQAADYRATDVRAWGGFRPMTPDGRPLVGATKIPGLFVNVGHGMLGWTLACATAYDAAHAVAGVR